MVFIDKGVKRNLNDRLGFKVLSKEGLAPRTLDYKLLYKM